MSIMEPQNLTCFRFYFQGYGPSFGKSHLDRSCESDKTCGGCRKLLSALWVPSIMLWQLPPAIMCPVLSIFHSMVHVCPMQGTLRTLTGLMFHRNYLKSINIKKAFCLWTTKIKSVGKHRDCVSAGPWMKRKIISKKIAS